MRIDEVNAIWNPKKQATEYFSWLWALALAKIVIYDIAIAFEGILNRTRIP